MIPDAQADAVLNQCSDAGHLAWSIGTVTSRETADQPLLQGFRVNASLLNGIRRNQNATNWSPKIEYDQSERSSESSAMTRYFRAI